MRFRAFFAAFALASTLVGTSAWAQVEVESIVEKETIVTRDGASVVVREPADKVVPGEVVVYTYKLRNTGDAAANNVAPSTRIPEGMVYVPGSAEAEGATATLSADAGQSFAPEGEVLVQGADGALRPAAPEEFTNIRWMLQGALPPGAERSVGFKAQLR